MIQRAVDTTIQRSRCMKLPGIFLLNGIRWLGLTLTRGPVELRRKAMSRVSEPCRAGVLLPDPATDCYPIKMVGAFVGTYGSQLSADKVRQRDVTEYCPSVISTSVASRCARRKIQAQRPRVGLDQTTKRQSLVVLPPRSKLKIAHLYQESGIRFCEPQAAQLHIYHTIRGLQQAGHEVTLLALQGRQVLCTQDLQVFKSDELLASHYGRPGLSGTALFKRFESGVRRLQSELHLPYLALFDSYRMAEAGSINLKGFDLIHERFNLLALGGAWASRRLGIPFVLEVNADLLEQRKFKGIQERGLRRLFAIWATRMCFRTAAQIICISPRLKEHLNTKWNIDESKLTVLPCAADVEAFKPNHNSADCQEKSGFDR